MLKLYNSRCFFILLFFISGLGINYAQEGGYTNKLSVAQGETISFHISTSVTPFNLSIYKLTNQREFITSIDNLNGVVQPVPNEAYLYGCGWIETTSFIIPEEWTPGVYRADFPTSLGNRAIIFIVRENNPGTYSKMLMVLGTNTWQAYNNFGGKSLYTFNSTNNERSAKVSFLRPFVDSVGSGSFQNYEKEFTKWTFLNNINLEFASNYDVYSQQLLLNNYDIVFIIGHNEYWSRPERMQYENFVAGGGRMIILAANTSWWQVRYEDDGNTLVCYKNKDLDPLFGVHDSLVTVNWFDTPVNYPENILTGVSFKEGGYVNWLGYLLHQEGYGDIAAFNSHSWVYDGTGLSDGDEFGYESTIAGYEVDAALFTWQNGIPQPTGDDLTPLNFRILGITPAHNVYSGSQGHGTMGYYYNQNMGAVFNSSTVDWQDALEDDKTVQRITMNVIERFIQGNFPPEITSWSPSIVSNAVINKEDVLLNMRNYYIPQGNSLELSVSAEDPFNEMVNYFWTIDGTTVGSGPSYLYENTGGSQTTKWFEVKGNALNNYDTASISWNMFNQELAIYSKPLQYVDINLNYSYKLKVFNNQGGNLQYELLNKPDWLNISPLGLIYGTAPVDTGTHFVEVRVTNEQNLSDIQSYYVSVGTVVVGINDESPAVPSSFNLYQNYPNPFNPETIIKFDIASPSNVVLSVYNIIGEEIRTIHSGFLNSGSYSLRWDGKDNRGNNVSSGTYLYRIKAGDYVQTMKMILLR